MAGILPDNIEQVARALPPRPPIERRTDDERAFMQFITDAAAFSQAQRAAAEREDYERELCGLIRTTLERSLEAELIELTRSPATEATYIGDLKRFKAYCDQAGASAMPAAPEIVANFLQAEHEAGTGLPMLKRLAAAISFGHKRFEKYDPTDDILVRAVIRHATKYGRPSVVPPASDPPAPEA